MNSRVSIVFCTCDSYSDLWDGFFRLFKKYWPEYDGEIIFNTDSIEYSYDGLNIVNVPHYEGESKAWSDMFARAIKMCKYNNILLILEDFYFMDYVNNKSFEDTVNAMENNKNIVSITYFKEPGYVRNSLILPQFMERKQFSLYKMTAHITLYKKDFLLSILKKGESAWEFEINGTVRSWFRKGKFLCMKPGKKPIIPYEGDFVRLGKFLRSPKEYFENVEGITFSDKRETIETLTVNSNKVTKVIRIVINLFKALLSFFKPNT